ncbi:hypothetical protein B0H13DRAFT_2305668 [Mycena leptocephala]|nr:hypothetical protein B0H13DRAFT_2305668 [Mycena leptocephala]
MLALTAHTLDLQSPHFQAVIQNIQGYTSDNAGPPQRVLARDGFTLPRMCALFNLFRAVDADVNNLRDLYLLQFGCSDEIVLAFKDPNSDLFTLESLMDAMTRRLAQKVVHQAAMFGPVNLTATEPDFWSGSGPVQSDEVSGPETHSGESKEAWKVRLLGAAGYPTDHASVSSYDVLEVLIPGWRVENYGKLLRESRLRNSGKHAQKYLRLYTDRVSTRIPRYAPYNSAIDQAWLE